MKLKIKYIKANLSTFTHVLKLSKYIKTQWATI